MRKVVFGVIITLIIGFTFKFCGDRKEKIVIHENSMLIQEQLKNVGKLVVTEGHFSDVYNYKNSKEIFAGITSEKKALVVVNAMVTIGYDLSKIEYDVDELTKTLRVKNIPEEDININPDLQYYDVESGYFNEFGAEDYNKIKDNVNKSLLEKIEKSTLKTNAKNRLISELSKFYILTNSMGWTLEYDETPIENIGEFTQKLKL